MRQRCLSAGIAAGAVICLSAGTVGTLPVSALGLGEIDTRSALNERFAAEIELLDTRGLDSAEVLASLASTDDFRRVGVERFFFLTSLKFDVTRSPRGNLVIKATSQQPITEPYLNFLVEVLWPSGRLLKEYTVLLDPPTFTHSAAAPVAAPSREQTDIGSAGRIQRDTPPVTSTTSTSAPAVAAPSSTSNSTPGTPRPQIASNDGTYGRTTRNDTLWTIASQTLPSENVTPQQNMLAIQRLNPTAFIDGNVNLLKEGVVLRLPSEAEASAVPKPSAVAEIDQQNQSWRAGSPARTASAAPSDSSSTSPSQASAATIDATSRGPGDAGSAPVTNDGRLSIVAADVTGAVDSIDSAGSSDQATAVVGNASNERLSEMTRKVDELTYQLDLQKRGVEEQAAESEKTISLKDQQIAQLEQQLKTIREGSTNLQPQDQSTSQTTPANAKPWWQETSVLGTALGGLALVLAGVLFSRRRKNADDLELDDLDAGEPSFELAPSLASETATPLGDADLLGDLEDADGALDAASSVAAEADLAEELSTSMDSIGSDDELSDDDLFGPADDASPADKVGATGSAAETSDVIGEADIYIAYGRYPQAIALLQGAVESNPEDHAVRMRLLEVSAETNDAESYARHAVALGENCSDSDTLAAAEALHDALETDFRAEVDALDGSQPMDASNTGLIAGAGAAIAVGAASVFAGADDADAEQHDEVESLDDHELESEAEPFAFDTTVSSVASDDLADEADSLLTGEFGGGNSDNSDDLMVDSDAVEAEFELDLDSSDDIDLDVLTDEIAADAAADFDQPAVNTDQFSTNVDMDLASSIPDSVEDFELDLDVDSLGDSVGDLTDDVSADSLGGDLGIDFPDETSELARVVAETDDDELLDEIERSLGELEADGLLTPELGDDVDFSFDDDADTSATKLDLARAYIDMGDDDGAREILGEVISEGDTSQKGEANELLDKL